MALQNGGNEMADETAKRDWVARVLGVQIGTTEAGGQAEDGPLLPIWLDAKDVVDTQLGKFQQALRGFGDPDLDRIAEFGLNGVTGTSSVGLMVALREADTPGAAAPQRRKLAEAIQSYRSFLNDDRIVALIDDNPFGVTLGLKSTLGGVLDELDRRIAA